MPEKDKIKVLFLCTANAARSQMAAGIVKYDFGDRIETYSAGTNPKGVSRLAVMVLDELGIRDVEIGDRWNDGEMVLTPGREGTQEKRIPLDVFFKKIVMVRDKLRVLEQKVNSHKGLSDEDKIQLQQYITGCYGTLTTFNVLFKTKDDQFSGQKK